MLRSKNQPNNKIFSCLTIDIEDWFHILDSPAVPEIKNWSSLESRIEKNLETLLDFLESHSVKATFFWLGWLAKRHTNLVRKCHDAGHEIASHGYAHLLVYKVSQKVFRQDITKAKAVLEDIISKPVKGFRAPGFSITQETPWAFDIIKQSGYTYDSSVYPVLRGHGGISESPLEPYLIETSKGHLLEIPMSLVKLYGQRVNLFGGGYLRLARKFMIKWGINRLQNEGRPLIIYIHPREIDPDHPRLPLSLKRRFKCYVNLKSTLPKLKWLCENYPCDTMLEMAENYLRSFYRNGKKLPIVVFQNKKNAPISSPQSETKESHTKMSILHNRLIAEKAVVEFFGNDILRLS